jgi:hypothetical protein
MFKPGQSGNPGGKSKIQSEFEKKCREYLADKGWTALEEMAQDRDKKVRQWSLEQMMNRGFGRPKEVVDVTTRDESLQSPESIAERIQHIITRDTGRSTPDIKPS